MTTTEAREVGAPLPRYRCHKEVWALKIESIRLGFKADNPLDEYDGPALIPENKRYAAIEVSQEWLVRFKPEAGGYWVQYKDGYTSYSPAEAFEDGYTLITNITQAPDTFTRRA